MTFQLTEKQNNAFQCMKNGHNTFLTGPGGTGKSFLLKCFIEWYKLEKEHERSKIYITSTTGLSSLLIDGITINRYCGIGTGEKPVQELFTKINKLAQVKKRWNETGVLIIDEISMMSADLFDKLEILAKKIRKNDLPFGGIQVILSGDFLQLPPVKSVNFCFNAFSWNLVINHTFYFDEIIRQDNHLLQKVLNKIRVGIIDDEVKSLLNSCLNRELTNINGIIPTLLFSRKNMVSEFNEKELEKIINSNIENHEFIAKYQFSKKVSETAKEYLKDLINQQYQIEEKIILSKFSQVMLNINLPEKGLANGSRGIIIDFNSANNNPIVKFLNNTELEIAMHEYTLDGDNGEVVKKIQIPLILAWAITIHKAQGMSLEFVKTDIGSSIFEYGQAYVVLSRITNINGLSLINIDFSKIKAHPLIIDFYNKINQSNIVN
jgi:ATP-dependent DNA helicase PIF1